MSVAVLKKAFVMFDQGKTGFIETAKLATIFNTLGQQVDSAELDEACHEFDKGSKFRDKFAFFLALWVTMFSLETGKIDFDAFVAIASNFLEEDDDEAMQNELKEAFRLYDKEGNRSVNQI